MAEVEQVTEQKPGRKARMNTVLTSENSVAFYEKKLDLKPTEPKTETEVKAEAKPKAEPKAEAKTEEPQEKSPLQERFSELTHQRNMARDTAEAERQKREAVEKKLQEMEVKHAPKPTDAKPEAKDFADAFQYAEALSAWSVQDALKKQAENEAQTKAEAARLETVKVWQKNQNAFKAQTPDYDAMIQSSAVVVSNEITQAILESELGPQLLYHLAKNPEEAKALSALTTAAALRKLGKLEAKLETTEKPATQLKDVSPVEVSRAPTPITPLKGGTGADIAIDGKGNYTGSYQDWKRDRRAGKIQ